MSRIVPNENTWVGWSSGDRIPAHPAVANINGDRLLRDWSPLRISPASW